MTMGYVEQNLMPGEEVIYKAKLHWAMFLSPIWPLILAVLALWYGFYINSDQDMKIVFVGVAGLFFLSAIMNGLRALISFLTTEFALTNKRVIAKTGLVRRRSVELLLSKIESIGVNESILGRMLDFGTITVTGTGGTKEPFGNIAAPMELRKRVNTQIGVGV
jgi:uncharacterized membrane protein YdbT with pleckstrin-like domain